MGLVLSSIRPNYVIQHHQQMLEAGNRTEKDKTWPASASPQEIKGQIGESFEDWQWERIGLPKKIPRSTSASVQNHLWYLYPELVVLVLFNDFTTYDEKQMIALALFHTPHPNYFATGKPGQPNIHLTDDKPSLAAFIKEWSWLLSTRCWTLAEVDLGIFLGRPILSHCPSSNSLQFVPLSLEGWLKQARFCPFQFFCQLPAFADDVGSLNWAWC